MKQQFELWGLILTIIPLDLSLIDLTEVSDKTDLPLTYR